MYNSKSSFNTYLRNTILPLLPSGTSLYTSLNVEPVYPAIFVRYPLSQKSDIDQAEKLLIQIDCVSSEYNEREADQLIDELREKLNLRSGFGGVTNRYNYNDAQNPVLDGSIRWSLANESKRIDDEDNPELIRNVIELFLEYEL